jgi:hypothetical protein
MRPIRLIFPQMQSKREPAYESVAVCTTVVDDLLAAQLDAGEDVAVEAAAPVCSTVVDDLLDAQLERA